MGENDAMGEIVYGTLNDTGIIDAVNNNELIIEDFDRNNVRQACYELRAGNAYFDLSTGGTLHKIKDNDVILFKPHQTIVVITKEKFRLPNDILARFLTKGSLFSVGFAPINTYADPGFYGRMGIVMNNASNNYLKIECGTAIAKVEFERLQNPVKEQYHGQHGFETGVWPLRTDFIVERKDLHRYFPKMDEIQEIEAAYGPSVATIMQRILITERRFVFATIALIVTNLVVIGLSHSTQWLSPVMNVAYGIIANVGYALVTGIVTRIRWKKRSK